MKKLKSVQEDAAMRKITRVGMCALLALLLLFLLVTILSTTRLASQVKLISEHPFTVNGDISDVKTDLALMRLRTERLQSYNQRRSGLRWMRCMPILRRCWTRLTSCIWVRRRTRRHCGVPSRISRTHRRACLRLRRCPAPIPT